MAITAQNITWVGQGPTDTLQQLAQTGISGKFAGTLVGTVTLTLDGSLTSGDANYIDGTKQLNFNPSGVIAFVIGRSGAAATVGATGAVDSADTGGSKKVTLSWSAAGSGGNTLTFLVVVFR